MRYGHPGLPLRCFDNQSLTSILTPRPFSYLKKNCQHYNINMLFLSSDLQISTVGLWRILLRCSLEPSLLSISGTKSRNFPSTQCVPSHHAIVIRQSKSIVRRKAISLSSTKRVVSILQPNSVPVLYFAKNLHSSPHFSASIHSIPSISFATSQSGVKLSVLSPSSAGSNGIARAVGITAMYSNSMFVRSLRKSRIVSNFIIVAFIITVISNSLA